MTKRLPKDYLKVGAVVARGRKPPLKARRKPAVRRRRGPALSPEGRAGLARSRALTRSDAKYEAIGEALFAKAYKRAVSLGYWHDVNEGPGGRSSWRVGSWWSTVRCRKCREVRYAYARIGPVLVRFRSGKAKFVTRTPWPRNKVSALIWGMYEPHLDTRPPMGCQCSPEP